MDIAPAHHLTAKVVVRFDVDCNNSIPPPPPPPAPPKEIQDVLDIYSLRTSIAHNETENVK